jgi:hypothetical protein
MATVAQNIATLKKAGNVPENLRIVFRDVATVLYC